MTLALSKPPEFSFRNDVWKGKIYFSKIVGTYNDFIYPQIEHKMIYRDSMNKRTYRLKTDWLV